jgi:hypothetical protein
MFYAPNAFGTFGNPFDSFTYTVSDGQYSTSAVTQTIIVLLVNSIVIPQTPIAVSVPEDSSIIIMYVVEL